LRKLFDNFIYIRAHKFVSEENKRGLAEIRNEGAPASIPQKQKTSKAERRAIQEAQRAAKAAAKEAGNCHDIGFCGALLESHKKPLSISNLYFLFVGLEFGGGKCAYEYVQLCYDDLACV
jgi:hypothetical protein